MDLKEKTLIELKAMVYDESMNIQISTRNIKLLDIEIAKKEQEEKNGNNK